MLDQSENSKYDKSLMDNSQFSYYQEVSKALNEVFKKYMHFETLKKTFEIVEKSENNNFCDYRVSFTKSEEFDGGFYIRITFFNNISDKLNRIIDDMKKYPVRYLLDFSQYNKLGDVATQQLISLIIKNKLLIHELNLNYQDVSDDSAEAIAKLIAETEIKSLSLEAETSLLNVGMTRPVISSEGLNYILPALVKNTCISLNLSGNDIDGVQGYVFSILQERNQYRESFDLKNMQNKTKKRWANFVEENTQLKLENRSLKEQLQAANEIIKKLDLTHKDMILENQRLKEKVTNFSKSKEIQAINIQKAVRGFFAKNELKDRKRKCIDLIEQNIQVLLKGYRFYLMDENNILKDIDVKAGELFVKQKGNGLEYVVINPLGQRVQSKIDEKELKDVTTLTSSKLISINGESEISNILKITSSKGHTVSKFKAYKTVAKLSELLDQGNLHEAMQVIRDQEPILYERPGFHKIIRY